MPTFVVPKYCSSPMRLTEIYLPFAWWWYRKRPHGYCNNRGHLNEGLVLFLNIADMEKQNEVRADLKRALSTEEYNTIVDVLKRFDGDGIPNFDGDSIFQFANYSFRGFLKELPIEA